MIRLLAFALTICLTAATWSHAQKQTVTVKVPASQATFELPSQPTAADLSGGSKLSDYINAELKAARVCRLPGGIIRTDKPIDLYRVLGGRIEGVGMAPGDGNKPDGFRGAATTQAHTTIIGPDPVFRLRACQGLSIEHLTIEGKGVGISYEHVPGWPCNYLTLHKVAINAPLGFRAGDKISDHNAADVTFDDCFFCRFKVAIEVNHNQGVNYHVRSCDFLHGDTAVLLNHGGLVHLLDPFGFVNRWLVIKGGGPNVMPCRITNLNSDREPQDAPPVIVDASEAVDVVKVVVDGVKVTQQWGDAEKYPGHVYYKLPSNAYAAPISKIRVRDNDCNSYPAGGVFEPVGGI